MPSVPFQGTKCENQLSITARHFTYPGVNTFYVNLANCVIDSYGNVLRCMFTKKDGLHLSRLGNKTMKYKLRSILNNFRNGLTSKYLGRLTTKMVHYYLKQDKKMAGW